jgi:hypothetical protein
MRERCYQVIRTEEIKLWGVSSYKKLTSQPYLCELPVKVFLVAVLDLFFPRKKF